MHIKLNPKEVMISPDKYEEYVKDNKGSLLVAITVTMAAVFVLSLSVSSFVCYRNHIACFKYRPRNVRDNQIPDGTDDLNPEVISETWYFC